MRFPLGLHATSNGMYSADKSCVYIDVRYTWLFSSLETPCWAWGIVVLTMIYMTIGVATVPKTRQLAVYLSILQVYEHFLIFFT